LKFEFIKRVRSKPPALFVKLVRRIEAGTDSAKFFEKIIALKSTVVIFGIPLFQRIENKKFTANP
jgi:hypothetical protein